MLLSNLYYTEYG